MRHHLEILSNLILLKLSGEKECHFSRMPSLTETFIFNLKLFSRKNQNSEKTPLILLKLSYLNLLIHLELLKKVKLMKSFKNFMKVNLILTRKGVKKHRKKKNTMNIKLVDKKYNVLNNESIQIKYYCLILYINLFINF